MFSITSAIGVPVVFPSNTPDKIRTTSSSRRCVENEDVPGLRRSKSPCKSASDSVMPGGTPSTIAVSAGPCDSPAVITRNTCPMLLPAIRCCSQKWLDAHGNRPRSRQTRHARHGQSRPKQRARQGRFAARPIANCPPPPPIRRPR